MKGWEDRWTAQHSGDSSPHTPVPCSGFQHLLGGQVALIPSRLAGFWWGRRVKPQSLALLCGC